ncbi:MAG: ABC transporter substrate-binding protein [Oscillospiraceae bacterium]|nr:ABC transporter substrate-binding protein [Oscillospiraceae bacterium]
MKTSRFFSILLVLCMVFCIAAAGGSAFAADDQIIIGLISPNTGALAAYGTGIVTGADLAVEEINAAGGILGRQVQLIKTDDQSDPTECLNAFNSLVAKGVGLIIGSATSGCTSAITDAANEEEVCILSPTATADSITTEDDFIFRACYADSFQGAIAAAYAKQAGFDKVGVVYCAADVYSKGLFDSFSKACAEYGIELAAEQSSASLDVQDYTNQFTAMVNAGVEFVYAPYYYDVIGPYVVPQARAAGYSGIIMGADGYDTTPDYVVAGADLTAFNDVYWTNHYDPSDTSEKVSSFVQAYEAKYGSIPSAFGATGYDCVYMYKQAIEAAGSEDSVAVRDALADRSAVYECVTGTFSLDESGTPLKGAAIISFQSDGSTVTSKLVDVVTQLP